MLRRLNNDPRAIAAAFIMWLVGSTVAASRGGTVLFVRVNAVELLIAAAVVLYASPQKWIASALYALSGAFALIYTWPTMPRIDLIGVAAIALCIAGCKSQFATHGNPRNAHR